MKDTWFPKSMVLRPPRPPEPMVAIASVRFAAVSGVGVIRNHGDNTIANHHISWVEIRVSPSRNRELVHHPKSSANV